jgi:hypothetical protein
MMAAAAALVVNQSAVVGRLLLCLTVLKKQSRS